MQKAITLKPAYQRQSDKRWVAELPGGKLVGGVLKTRYFYGRTRGDAEAKRKPFAEALGLGLVDNTLAGTTVAALVVLFLAHLRAIGRAANTVATYESAMRTVGAKLGPVQCATLDSMLVSRYLDDRIGEGFARNRVIAFRNVLHVLCAFGVARGYMTVNPCAGLDKMTRDKVATAIWSTEEVNALLDAAKLDAAAPYLYPALALALGTGMRRGEIAGLEVADVELPAARVHVLRSLDRKRIRRVGAPDRVKTAHADRIVPLPVEVVGVLAAWIAKRAELRKRAEFAGRWHETGALFVHDDGSAVDPHTLYQHAHAAMLAAKVRPLPFHATRHTAAVYQLKAGVPLTTLSIRLGHARPSFTHDRYAHHVPEAALAAPAPSFGAMFGRTSETLAEPLPFERPR